MALQKRIMHTKLNSAGSDSECIDKLSEWQQVVRENERISGKELDQTVRTATLMEEAPPQVQGHLRLRSEGMGTDYKKVIQAIEGCVPRRKFGILEAQLTKTLAQSTRARVSPKDRARAKAKADEGSKCFACGKTFLPKIVITEFAQ